ncbi:MAG TPA: CopG family transcriptional regulator [Candidatus Kapabacteria bacterium]|nr:CopG family transcriptional regulator [Candidatus Kapabacteria bacterium]
MPQKTSMTIHLPVDTNARLEALAKVIHIPRNDLAARAIRDYLDLQEYRMRSIKEAVEEADSPHAEFLEHAEVVERLKNIDYR